MLAWGRGAPGTDAGRSVGSLTKRGRKASTGVTSERRKRNA